MSNGNNQFSWNQDRWDRINKAVHDAAHDMRVIRPLFKLYGQQGTYVEKVDGHQVDYGPPLSIKANQTLSTIKISSDFNLRKEQYEDEYTAQTLAVEAAYRVAAAEEAIILLGSEAAPFLQTLKVDFDQQNLKQQTGLFQQKQQPVAQPILDSIIQGINELQAKGRFRNYAAIVSLDLYQEAMKERKNPFDAQIYEIRPLLVEKGTVYPDGGFLYSQAAAAKTGVVLSLSGDGIKISIPVDTRVEPVKEEKDMTLQVIEQIRLLIDVPEAVVALK